MYIASCQCRGEKYDEESGSTFLLAFPEEVSVLKKHVSAFTCISALLLWLGVACQSPAPATTPGGGVAATQAGQTPATTVVPASTSVTTGLPRPAHVVIVMEENHSYSDIIGSASAPYINSLASKGALFTSSFAITHPSEPNYLALFSGSTQGVSDDSCPHTFTGANLASELSAAGLSFASYAENLPGAGYTGCTSPDGLYARKHNPWVNFTTVPSSANLPFSSFADSSDYSHLPTVSFVIPNLNNDMHNGTIQEGDSWLKNNLAAYAQWAETHNSLLIVTWDEDDGSQSNQIPTLFVGQMVKAGRYGETINHYTVLRTLEDMYGLPAVGNSANVSVITDCWL